MTHLFISDLHLSPDHPRLVRGFLDLLKYYQDQQTQLYILGDWFNAWVGDDDRTAWLDEIVQALKHFQHLGNQVYFLVGNRDFALGTKFLDQFNGILLNDIDHIMLFGQHIRLEHGDALCTDDLSYQRFRKVIRHPWVIGTLKCLPLQLRKKLANGFRKKSQQANQIKSYSVMDVNSEAVSSALMNVDLLIHGHTHRAAIHEIQQKKRIVLGDWKLDHAEILEIRDPNQDIQLKTWYY